MTQEHPITPLPELVNQWCIEGGSSGITSPQWFQIVATQAARWGADQELEACCEWASQFNYDDYRYQDELHALRRPKLSSLKEQALAALSEADQGLNESEWQQRSDTIRRALEQLDD